MMEKRKYFFNNRNEFLEALSSVSMKWWKTRYIIAKMEIVSSEKVVIRWKPITSTLIGDYK